MSDNTGAMIAHFPQQTLNSLVELASTHFPDYAVPSADMHLTLAYLGEAADLGDDDEMEMGNILQGLSERLAPMPASINGITRFLDSDPNPVVVNFDCPGLSTLRAWLMDQLRSQGIPPVLNHGFTPHITLAYLPADKSMPDVTFSPIPVTLDSLTLAVGDKRQTFPAHGSVTLSEARHMATLSESGVYDVSMAELQAYGDGLSESVPKGAPESDFASPPSGLYVGDAKHAALAVQAVTSGLEGNVATDKGKPGVKSKIEGAVRKFYKGKMRQYYLTWLHTGKKPAKRPASDMHIQEMYIVAPLYSVNDEPRFPTVPTASGVDLAALMAVHGDTPETAVFVTRPLSILDEVSLNGLPYNRNVCNDVFNQVISKRPVARRGHIAEADKSSLFPPDEGYWIGAVWDTEVYGKPAVFGKCYVVPGETRDMVLSRRATGTALSNSLWGDVTTTEDSDGQVVPIGVEIESIDFVPEERAALQALGGDFMVTSEMKKPEGNMAIEDLKEAIGALKPDELHEMMSEAQRHHVAETHLKTASCSECTDAVVKGMLSEGRRRSVAESVLHEESPEETYKHMSETQRAYCAEAYAKETGKALEETTHVSEMSTRMSTLEKSVKDRESSLAEMEKVIKGYQRADFERSLDATVETYFVAEMRTDKGKAGVLNLKRQMRKGAMAEMAGMDGGQTPDNIKTACDKVWEEDTKTLTEMFYASAAGPGVVVAAPKGGNAQDFRTGVDSNGFFDRDFMQTAKAASAGAQRPGKRGAK